MKTSTKFFLNAGIAFLMAASLVSCQLIDTLPIASNDVVFDAELFKENLNAQLTGARGYQFVITRNGNIAETEAVGIGGISRTGAIPSSIDGYVNIASVTKTLTATAALRILPKAKVDLGDVIGPWLPVSWDIHPDISQITFRQLLTHTSGIRTSRTGWTTLQNMVSSPIMASKVPEYADANF
ncbi:serine hydrolase [Algoriphagus resistens]|uniref:serine hydrolase n=1 Tax=Algoriphagus resistens TaxID=1750590 RepID=UPI0007168069|nr:serine hydrolase [Algoriphagus resistens]